MAQTTRPFKGKNSKLISNPLKIPNVENWDKIGLKISAKNATGCGKKVAPKSFFAVFSATA